MKLKILDFIMNIFPRTYKAIIVVYLINILINIVEAIIVEFLKIRQGFNCILLHKYFEDTIKAIIMGFLKN